MITINAQNVNDALWMGSRMLREHGVQRDSRNGPVLVMPQPVTTVFEHPDERVILHKGRDANPFFHLVEALWMLAGRRDLPVLTKYVKRMADFSDDGGKTQPGAYGFRWRHHFNVDQLSWAARRLREDPNDRRVVIQMWDPRSDVTAADHGGRDVPCNISMLPWVGSDGRLNLTVYNRSHDMVWGAYGANAVHFSVALEYLADQVDLPLGQMWFVSNNFHAYLSTLPRAGTEWPWGYDSHEAGGCAPPVSAMRPDPYSSGAVSPLPMFGEGLTAEEVLDDITVFLRDPARVGIRSNFLKHVALPMVMAHRAYRQEGAAAARELLQQMPEGNDWRAGAELWVQNREEARRARAADDGVSYEAD